MNVVERTVRTIRLELSSDGEGRANLRPRMDGNPSEVDGVGSQ